MSSLRTFRAQLSQRYHDRVHGRDVDVRGSIALRRPDGLTVRFDEGGGFALSGTAVTAVDPAGAVVHERTLGDDDYTDLRAILAGTATLAETFDVRSMGSRPSGEVLELRPRGRALWDRAIIAWGEDGLPQRMLVVDEAGNTLRWVFTRGVASATLPGSAMLLPIPYDAEHVRP